MPKPVLRVLDAERLARRGTLPDVLDAKAGGSPMMQRLFPRGTGFPPYTPGQGHPGEQLGAEIHRWGKRILTLVALLGVFGTAASYGGWKVFGPSAQIEAVQSSIALAKTTTDDAIAAVRDSGAATSRRVDEIDRMMQANLYIGCELLRRSQPHAIAPKECSDEAQRARRDR